MSCCHSSLSIVCSVEVSLSIAGGLELGDLKVPSNPDHSVILDMSLHYSVTVTSIQEL